MNKVSCKHSLVGNVVRLPAMLGLLSLMLLGSIFSIVHAQAPTSKALLAESDSLNVKNDRLAGPLRKIFESQQDEAAVDAAATNYGAQLSAGMVSVDIVVRGDIQALQQQLLELGAQRLSTFGYMISARVPIDKLETISNLAGLREISAVMAKTNTGAVTSQGDFAMRSDVARTEYDVDGAGVVVGALSDSYDCLGGAASDVASGDLPAGVVVLDDSICATDEGRALLQIVSDVAPGSDLAFHTAIGGQADFANGIIELAEEANATVIVDDVYYFREPFFQDGIIAQAVDRVEQQGVSFFKSAGNNGRQSYQSEFRSSGTSVLHGDRGDAHDFDPGPGVDVMQKVTIPSGGDVLIIFQWDEPFASVSGQGSAYDLDIALVSEDGTEVVEVSQQRSIGGDPVEVLFYDNFGDSTVFNIVIEHFDPNDDFRPGIIKYIDDSDGLTELEYGTASSTVVGHSNAAGAISVGAVRYDQTPFYGVDPPLSRGFSSAGNTPILFDTRGKRVAITRNKPEIMAPDGVNTTFFGQDLDGDLFPNFSGTSAAAPHAAGLAALMLEKNSQLSPEQIRQRLIKTAVDMQEPGFDFDSGYGLISATAALALDNQPPQLSWESQLSVEESETIVELVVELDRAVETDISFQAFTRSGSASSGPGGDFFGLSQLFIITAGELSVTIPVTLLPDQIVEGNETFEVFISNVQGAGFDNPVATVTIVDDDGSDGRIRLDIGDATVTEGEDDEAVVELLLSRPAATDITVEIASRQRTAISGPDYLGRNFVVVFEAGETTKKVRWKIVDNTQIESDETFAVVFVRSDKAVAGSAGTVLIKDDDESGIQPIVSVGSTAVVEGVDDEASVEVGLSKRSTVTVVAVVASRQIEALSGPDYLGRNIVVEFSPGETVKKVNWKIVDDEVEEPTETFRATVVSATNAQPGGDGLITIRDNDSNREPTLVSIGSVLVTEGVDQFATVIVRLSRASDVEVTAEVASRQGSAISGQDYLGRSYPVSFAAGETSTTVSWEIVDDQIVEDSEAFRTVVVSASNAGVGEGGLVTIEDNDGNGGEVVVNIGSVVVVEGVNNEAVVDVSLSAASTVAVVAQVASRQIDAISGLDYLGRNYTVEFAPGETTKKVGWKIIDDEESEPTENFRTTVLSASNARPGEDGLVTIRDNDGSEPLKPVEVSIGSAMVTEGVDELATVAVNLSRVSDVEVTVEVASRQIDAISGPDYLGRNYIVKFAPGETTKPVSWAIVDDDINEPTESFRTTVIGATNARPGADGLVTIEDNDGGAPLN